MSEPGSDRLCRALCRWLDETTIREIVEPTLADLQHELHEAGSGRRATLTVAIRGYAALGRALLVYGVGAPGSSHTLLSIGAIGIGGGALYAWARDTVGDPRVFFSAFLLPMCAAPVVLRAAGVSTYRRLFLSLLAVGALVWSVSGGLYRSTTAPSWMLRAVISLVNLAAIAVASAVGAAALWTPAARSTPLARRLVLGLLAAALVTTSVHDASLWLTGAPERRWVVTLPFSVVMFAAPIGLTSLPVLLVSHRWIRTHAGLALAGALLSPLPMLMVLYLDMGRTSEVLRCLREAPSMSALMTLPFTIGGGVLGWALPGRRAGL